jgi:hypothetical protein
MNGNNDISLSKSGDKMADTSPYRIRKTMFWGINIITALLGDEEDVGSLTRQLAETAVASEK